MESSGKLVLSILQNRIYTVEVLNMQMQLASSNVFMEVVRHNLKISSVVLNLLSPAANLGPTLVLCLHGCPRSAQSEESSALASNSAAYFISESSI